MVTQDEDPIYAQELSAAVLLIYEADYKKKGGWRAMGSRFGIAAGTLNRVATLGGGYLPTHPVIMERLIKGVLERLMEEGVRL